MAKRLILPFVFFIHVTMHSANARGEGEYTDYVPGILREMDDDQSVWSGDHHTDLERVSLRGGSFTDICNDASQTKKLSICMRIVQHKWKRRNPTSFTVNPTKSDYKCRATKFLGAGNHVFYHRMFVCPAITVKTSGRGGTESSFLVGQGLHPTQYRVYVYKREKTAIVEGQVTGLSLDKLNFETDNKNYVYTPGSDSGNAVVSFRSSGSMSDFRLKWEEMSDYEVSSKASGAGSQWR